MQQVVPRTHQAPGERTRREPLAARLVVSVDRVILGVARRWLPPVNAVVSGWFAALILAPLLRVAGAPGVARPIYATFSLVCHQDPSRSFDVGGSPLACCHRCAAIYGASAAAGLGFATVRERLRPRGPRMYEVAALLAPAAVDGTGGLLGWWNGVMPVRVATGALVGVAMVWLVYPFLDAGFARIRERLEGLFARLASEGRFQ